MLMLIVFLPFLYMIVRACTPSSPSWMAFCFYMLDVIVNFTLTLSNEGKLSLLRIPNMVMLKLLNIPLSELSEGNTKNFLNQTC